MSDRRYLITIGSPECPGYGLAVLRRVAGDVERVAGFFTDPDQGYEHALSSELSLGATADQIRNHLDCWFAHEDRRESDCVVVYIAGHGDYGDKFKDHYLLTRDSEPRRVNSVIQTAEFVRWFFAGEGERPQNVLLILDVCFAGGGAGEAAAQLVKGEARALHGGAGFWVIATSDPNTEAGDGAFVDAFLDVMKDEAWMPRGGEPFLSPNSLSEAVNARFNSRRLAQQAVGYSIGTGRTKPPFIRNPGFTRDLDGVSVADRAHWDPKARGVDVAAAPGWFFTGRHEALRELCAWLRAERSDLHARVVTGGPGSGKSAVLGWLVLASREETRQGMQEAGLLADPLLVPPLGSVAARVHARGMRLNEMTEMLATLLSSAARDPAALITELSFRPGPLGIVVDSLDEAAEAVMIERELLVPLAACPPVRLIVGGRRRNGRPPLEVLACVLDLDESRYFERADLAAYVFARLTSSPSVYAPEAWHVHARRIATLVAERAGYSFLYARLVSRTLSQASAPVDTERAGWQAELKLPADLPDAFGADLERFDEETRRRFVDLLVPLAYARGKGLPQKNVWATVASRIAGREYTNADLRELKDRAGYYLVQDTESEEVVFRLFHQTFADYLKALTQDEGVDRSFAEALLMLLPSTTGGIEPWSQVSEPYLLNHFPTHASAGGLLENQLKNPGFLLHVSPEALLPELHRANSLEAQRAARAYRRASHWIRSGDDTASLMYLLWGAYQHGARDLAENLQALRPRLPWYPEWAVWQPVISGHVLAQGDASITAMATGQDRQGDPVAICGYHGGTICVWNLTTSEKLLEYTPTRPRERQIGPIVYERSVGLLTSAVCQGRNAIIAAWNEGSVGVIDLQDGSELGWWTSEKASNSVHAFCLVPEPPGCLLVAATNDFSLHVWQLPALEVLGRRENAAAAKFYGLAFLEFNGQSAVVSATDSVANGEHTEEWPIRIWRTRDLELLWRAGTERVANAMEVRVCKVGTTSWLVVRVLADDLILLNPATDATVHVARGFYDRFSRIIGFHRSDTDVLLIGERFSRLRVLSLRPGDKEDTLSIDDLPIRTEVRGGLWSDMVELNGRSTLLSADDRQLRVWDVQELLAADTTEDTGHDARPFGSGENSLVAVAAHASGTVTGSVGSGFSDLRLWDIGGRLLWGQRFEGEILRTLALADVDGTPMVVWGTAEGVFHTTSALDGTELREPAKIGLDILAVSVHAVSGRPTALLAVNLKSSGHEKYPESFVVRALDLRTGEEIDTTAPDPYGIYSDKEGQKRWALAGSGYYRSKILWCVDALDWEESTIVAFAGPHGEVRAMGLESLKEVDRWQGGESGDYVHAIALGICDGRPLAFGGDEKGRLFARDLAMKKDVCPRLDSAHRGRIEALVVHQTVAGFCVASGGMDGVVNLWRTDLSHMARIETERPVMDLAFVGSDRLTVATDRGLTLVRLDWELLFSKRLVDERGASRAA